MGVEVPRSTAELRCVRQCFERLELLLQAVDVDLDFLAEARGGGWLPVSTCQHRYVLPLRSIELELIDQPTKLRQEDVLDSFADHQREGRIVDVLGGEPEVDELLLIAQAEGIELLLDEVLDGLDVVIRHALDLLDSEGILGGEAQIDIVEAVCAVLAEDTTEVWELFAEGDEVEDLYTYAVADEGFL